MFRFAPGCAEQADDSHLRAQILDNTAAQATLTGRPDDGHTLTEHALVRADRLTPTMRAMVHTTRARALAKVQRVRETLIAVGTAEATDRLAAAVAGHTAGYTRSRAISQIKLASLTMATGDPVEAATLDTAALDTVGTIRSRRTTDDLRELARHTTRHPEIDEVTALGSASPPRPDLMSLAAEHRQVCGRPHIAS